MQLREMIEKMNKLAEAAYWASIHAGCHAFIEFNGLINEYIKLCTEAIDLDIDFTQADIHTGGSLPMMSCHASYLGEKFECIFGTTFRANPEMWKIFCARVMGE